MTIPKNLDECFSELKRMFPENKIDDFKSWKEDEIFKAHMGLGMWIRNNWGLWQGGELKDYLIDLGFTHPDDMSHTILLAFHRHLRNLTIDLKKEAAYYKEYWDKTNKENGQ